MLTLILSSLLFIATFLFVGSVSVFLFGFGGRRSILEWSALSLGLGFVFVPVVFFVISHLAGGTQPWIPYALCGSAFACTLGIAWKKKSQRPSIDRSEAVLKGIVALNVALMSLYFATYPIFPDSGLAHDYAANLVMLSSTQSLLYGGGSTTVAGLTQLTSAFFMLYGVVSLQGNPLIALRYSMVVAAAVVPLLVYYLSFNLFKDKEASLFATAAYSFVFPFWSLGVLSSGYYAQFYAGILFLLALWLITE